VLVARNAVIDNNTGNFAPKGNIVASVPAGTGVMVMANKGVQVLDNALVNNSTSHVMLIAYTQAFEDERYEPRPIDVVVRGNIYGSGGNAPDFEGGGLLAGALGGALPPVLTDGLHQNLAVEDAVPVVSLGLLEVGQPFAQAQPQLIQPVIAGEVAALPPVSLPGEMEGRLK